MNVLEILSLTYLIYFSYVLFKHGGIANFITKRIARYDERNNVYINISVLFNYIQFIIYYMIIFIYLIFYLLSPIANFLYNNLYSILMIRIF